jgi:hypothetical protein
MEREIGFTALSGRQRNRWLGFHPSPSMKHHAFDFVAPLSPLGLMLGAAAFVAALTPSMIPRPGVLQGVEAGIAFALLYGVGTGARALGSWLELPRATAIPALFSGYRSLCACPLSATGSRARRTGRTPSVGRWACRLSLPAFRFSSQS